MLLILLRYPALLDVVAQITPRLHDVADGVAIDPAGRCRPTRWRPGSRRARR